MTDNHGIALTLHIIESPSPDEIFDARTEGSVLREALRIAGIPVSYKIAVNAQKLVNAIELFVDQRSHEPGALPILHLSMHGHSDGVQLTDGTPLRWELLRDLLLCVAEGELIVCLSSCYGFSGCRMAMAEHTDIPFLALIGHNAEVSISDAAIGYAAFYNRLFKGATIPVAVDAMKRASGDDRFLYISGPEARRIWHRQLSKAQAERARAQLERYLQQILTGPESTANLAPAPNG